MENKHKYLVISGGGPLGFAYFGMLHALHDRGDWSLDTLESIYATSVGAIIAVYLCYLKQGGCACTWESITTALITHPWNKEVEEQSNSPAILGVFNRDLVRVLLERVLGVNISRTTLQQLHDTTGIALHLYTTNINSFESVELEPASHPNLSVLDAVYMSCALPLIFEPLFDGEDGCYVDGGLLANYPWKQCVAAHPGEKVLAIYRKYVGENVGDCSKESERSEASKTSEYPMMKLTAESTTSFLSFAMGFAVNTLTHLMRKENQVGVPTEVADVTEVLLPLSEKDRVIWSPDYFVELLLSEDLRRTWIERGFTAV